MASDKEIAPWAESHDALKRLNAGVSQIANDHGDRDRLLHIRTLSGILKSKTSMTQALLKERARDKKREEAKFKKFRRS